MKAIVATIVGHIVGTMLGTNLMGPMLNGLRGLIAVGQDTDGQNADGQNSGQGAVGQAPFVGQAWQPPLDKRPP